MLDEIKYRGPGRPKKVVKVLPKKGRPKKPVDVVKSKQMRIRMTEGDYICMKAMAHKTGKNVTDLIRDALKFYADKKLGYRGFDEDHSGYWKEYYRHFLR